MAFAVGVSSRTFPASASHQVKKASTIALDSRPVGRRSGTPGSASPAARSTRNRPPMYASAWRARSASVSSAFHQYRRGMRPQHVTRSRPRVRSSRRRIEDRVRVGDQVALVSLEQPVDGRAVALFGVAEKHTPLGRDHHRGRPN